MEHSILDSSDPAGITEKLPFFGKNFKFIQELENQSLFQRKNKKS